MTRLVLVHDWLTGLRGGEKCLESLCRRFPSAKLFTLLHARGSVPAAIERLRPRASWLNRLPGWPRYYRYLLPLMPLAARWPIPPCDLVVSFSHCVAKAARAPAGVPHVCYCFTPMRYAWHQESAYFGGGRGLVSRLRALILARLREWDRSTSDRVTHFVAISRTVQDLIRECYGCESVVICPPVETEFYTPDAGVKREEFYLVASALAPYKRFEQAIQACAKLGRPLVVIGKGQAEAELRRLAGPGVAFLGYQSDEVIRDHLRRCKALLFPGEEDFGIVPVEAMACGAPVIALGRGGVAETVVGVGSGRTGVLYAEPTVDALVEAMREFESLPAPLDPATARLRALEFSRSRYEAELLAYLERVLGRPLVE